MFINISHIEELCQDCSGVLFVNTTNLKDFVENTLPSIQTPFTLVTGGSDLTVPFHVKESAKAIFKNPKVIKWFATNCVNKVGKLEYLPLGLDYGSRVTGCKRVNEADLTEGMTVIARDTSLEASGWIQVGNAFIPPNATVSEYSYSEQEEDIQRYRCTEDRKPICYANFHFFTDSLYGRDREEAIREIPSECVEYEKERLPRRNLYERMSQYKYVISPFGNGVDCYRTWEALAVGCIPIVRSSGLDGLFEGLPVMIVKKWSDVTREALDTFIPDKSQIDKLKLEYWLARIKG